MNDNFRDVAVNRMAEYVNDLYKEIHQDFSPDQKIAQIKKLRDMTGFGLKDSKDIIETGNYLYRMDIIIKAVTQALRVETPLAAYLIRNQTGKTIVYRGQSPDECIRVKAFLEEQFNCYGFELAKPF